jgi:hypothetical protein
LLIGESDQANCGRDIILRELEYALRGLAYQLIPLETYAKVIYQPQKLTSGSVKDKGPDTAMQTRDKTEASATGEGHQVGKEIGTANGEMSGKVRNEVT